MKNFAYLLVLASSLLSTTSFAADKPWGYCRNDNGSSWCKNVQTPGSCEVRFTESDYGPEDAGKSVYNVNYSAGCNYFVRNKRIGHLNKRTAQLHYYEVKVHPCMVCDESLDPLNKQ